ncbi:MAG: hypothetical protein QOF87_1678 [Pseudonocardiales bacterium]|jgi:hypothetical protein|nr:hypothetical protein [Pseudonocardiales bacterium]MDT4907611.1 hypothetical protein [Pseudonocardiales bacterium]MDT4959575.1 hypothetical protein [Pseudonocardiales bacterium]MDT4962031.1 hypothetical protein [Pseudonocardiales bacterium]
MRLGGSLFLIAIGAILKFAVTKRFSGVDVGTVGVILMLIGVVGLALSVYWMNSRRRTDVIQHGPGGAVGTTYVTPNDPIDGPY